MVVYDWSDQGDAFQWAAFYSDCEHEVQEVTSGHRITLNYNLYAREQLAGLYNQPVVDANSFPLYHRVAEALMSQDFLATGKPRKPPIHRDKVSWLIIVLQSTFCSAMLIPSSQIW